MGLLLLIALLSGAPAHADEPAAAAAERVVDVPREPRADEALYLEVTAGVLPPGAELELRSAAGDLIGSVSQYGVVRGRPVGARLIDLAPGLAAERPLRIQIYTVVPGAAARPSSLEEVPSVTARFVVVTPPASTP